MNEKIALDVSEAASILGVSRPTMYQIMNRADVHIDFYIGTRRKVSRKALQAWVDQQLDRESRAAVGEAKAGEGEAGDAL